MFPAQFFAQTTPGHAHGQHRIGDKSSRLILRQQVNIPKTRRTYCKGKECKKHTQHKVTQYKAGKVRTHPTWTTRIRSTMN